MPTPDGFLTDKEIEEEVEVPVVPKHSMAFAPDGRIFIRVGKDRWDTPSEPPSGSSDDRS